MNNPKTTEIVAMLRCRCECDECVCFDPDTGEMCLDNEGVVMAFAANCIEQLQQELIDERYRHDRLQDFCVAQGEELSKLKAQQRWIPVTERLPETGITVLTLDKRGHMRDRALHTFRGGQRLFRPDGLAPGYDILYWMPLPERPKEE